MHELAHQWSGDSLALARWRDIWLNEGFASYAEWLWAEDQGRATADEIFTNLASQPADDEFWDLTIGNPGVGSLFDGPVYDRGAMTLHALRRQMGDAAFSRLLHRWFSGHAQGNVTTRQFIDLAQRVSGQNLGPFFRTWLFTPTKPAGLAEAATPRTSAAGSRVVAELRTRHDLMHPRR